MRRLALAWKMSSMRPSRSRIALTGGRVTERRRSRLRLLHSPTRLMVVMLTRMLAPRGPSSSGSGTLPPGCFTLLLELMRRLDSPLGPSPASWMLTDTLAAGLLAALAALGSSCADGLVDALRSPRALSAGRGLAAAGAGLLARSGPGMIPCARADAALAGVGEAASAPAPCWTIACARPRSHGRRSVAGPIRQHRTTMSWPQHLGTRVAPTEEPAGYKHHLPGLALMASRQHGKHVYIPSGICASSPQVG